MSRICIRKVYSFSAYDSNENLTTMSITSDVSNPPSRRSSFGASDYHQVGCFDVFGKNDVLFGRMINLKIILELINSTELIMQKI